ncbi:hypothetical protein RUND412_003043 [Rhizina undulata]
MAEEEVDYSGLPLTERAVHKIWKVRKAAYEEAAAEFAKSPDEGAPCFSPWLYDPGLWKKVVTDSNVAAQAEGITALCEFLQYGGENACSRTRSHTINPLVEKGLSSTRAQTKQKSIDALLLYVELDTPGPVLEELMPFLNHKMPKLIAATVTALHAIYAAFGARTVDPKPVLKVLPKIFGHADKNVRAEGTKLAVELYKWLKEAMKPMFFGELKPVQQKELEEAFEKVKDETPKQERLLRSQQAAAAAAAASGVEEEEEAEEAEAEIDAFDLAEPVNVIAKLPKEFHEQVSSTKWKDRKEALDALFAALSVPRIKDDNYNEIASALAKCMKDANIAVVTVAANCIEVLSNGLRKNFSKYRQIVLSPVLERLKEKKQTVVDALAKALDGIFNSTSLTDCLEDIFEYLKHKNPNVKLETLKFLIRCLRTTRDVPSKPECKAIAEASAKLLSDTSGPTRDGAAEAMGTLMKILGERQMNPYMEGLDDIRKAKIKEFFETAEVKAKDKPKPVAPPPAAKPPPGKKSAGKPGLKAPMKKAAPPPVDDLPPAKPKVAPASKLGAPKALGAGGLKLQKKSAAVSPEDEAPPPASKLSYGGKGYLTGRTLAKETPAAPPAPKVDPMTAADKLELEELRAEKERWTKQNHEERAEKVKLMHEINDLQLQNAQLIEEHTRDNLTIRAKEAQLVRARADTESAESQVQKQQREIERLKREIERVFRSTSPAPTDIAEAMYREGSNNGFPGGSFASRTGSIGRNSNNRLSYASTTFSTEENQNGNGFERSRGVSPVIGSESGSGRTSAMGQTQGTDNIESWKRAAEVTSQLKLRIEQMKAKQGLAGRHQGHH